MKTFNESVIEKANESLHELLKDVKSSFTCNGYYFSFNQICKEIKANNLKTYDEIYAFAKNFLEPIKNSAGADEANVYGRCFIFILNELKD